MARWRTLLLGLLLVALVACGGAASTANRPLAEPTPTAAARGSVPPRTSSAPLSSAAPGTSAAPRASASASARASSSIPSAGASPAPSAAPTGPPVATQPAGIPPVAAADPQPSGTIPAGWKVYRGPRVFPFVIAYPPDWNVDDALLPEQRIVYFYGPDGREGMERIDIEIGQTQTGANIDVQRDEFFHRKSEFCEQKGIEYTEHRQIAGVAFAILGATCDASNELSFAQVASGLKGGDEWNILMRTPYDRKEARLRGVFDPMLASFNIYADAP